MRKILSGETWNFLHHYLQECSINLSIQLCKGQGLTKHRPSLAPFYKFLYKHESGVGCIVYINTGFSTLLLHYTSCFLFISPSLSKTSALPHRHIAPSLACFALHSVKSLRTYSEEAKSLFWHSLPRLRRFITVSNEQLDSEKWVRLPQIKKKYISTGASVWGLRILNSLVKFNEQPHFSWKISECDSRYFRFKSNF